MDKYSQMGRAAHDHKVRHVRGMGAPDEGEKKKGGMGWILLAVFGALAVAAADRVRRNR